MFIVEKQEHNEFYINWNAFWKGQLAQKTLFDRIILLGRWHFSKVFVSHISKIINIKKKHCLEVGAGTGQCSLLLRQKGAKVRVHDKEEILRSLWCKQGLDYIISDIRSIPVESASFDLVWCAGVLGHFKDPKPVLLEMKRVSCSGGTVCAFVSYKFNWTVLFRHSTETLYTKQSLKKLFNRCGFKNVNTKIMWCLGGMSICGWAKEGKIR